MTVAVGGDPEFFIWDKRKGLPIMSTGLIGGEKGNGVPISGIPKGVKDRYEPKWLEDNVAVELNFKQQSNADYLWDCICQLRTSANLALAKINPNYTVSSKSYHKFSIKRLNTNPKAMEIGCEPDFCAYIREVGGGFNPDNLQRAPFKAETLGEHRFAGGHLHLSFNNKDNIPHYALAMLCDAYLGLPAVVATNQGPRAEFYGRAGLYRPKSYGIEYRTPSNWWLVANSAFEKNYAYHFILQAYSLLHHLEEDPLEISTVFSTLPLQDICNIINSGDKEGAIQLYGHVYNLVRSSKLSKYTGPAINAGIMRTRLNKAA